jgi:hypothetical protein
MSRILTLSSSTFKPFANRYKLKYLPEVVSFINLFIFAPD